MDLPLIKLFTSITNNALVFLVDSGSEPCVISSRLLKPGTQIQHINTLIATLSGSDVKVLGEVPATLATTKETLGSCPFIVTNAPMKGFDGILGTNFLKYKQAVIDYDREMVSIGNTDVEFEHTLKGNTSLHSRGLYYVQTKDNASSIITQKMLKDMYSTPVRLRCKETITIPAEHYGYLSVQCPVDYKHKDLLFEATPTCTGLHVGSAIITCDEDGAKLPIMNVNSHTITIKRGDDIGWANVFEAATLSPRVLLSNPLLETGPHFDEQDNEPDDLSPKRDEELKDLIKEIVIKTECPDEMQQSLFKTLWQHRSVLARKDDTVGLCTKYKPKIKLDTEEPIYTAQYPIPFRMREAMDAAVQDFLADNIIQPSTSPYNSPTLMVPKRDGGFRLVVDFRRLNDHVITDPHPLPRISQIMEALGKARYFSALDLLHGFYNLEIDENDRWKTAFSTYNGHYEFLRLPMGLKNSPSVFQRLMNVVLHGCLGVYSFIYIDDIIIYSTTATEHLNHINAILQRLVDAGLKIKLSKCQFFQTEIEYLGFLVGIQGIKVNPRKLEAVEKYPVPFDKRGIQAFLGLIGYFRHFVSNFATRAKPLYQLLKETEKFQWTNEQQISFEDLKGCLLRAPVLAFPDFDHPFILTTDASAYALGAILTQEKNDREVLISCASRTLKEAETNYSNTDRELLGVVYGVKHFRSYLWGKRFHIFTDNSAITCLHKQKNSDNKRALRWHMELGEYDFSISHRKGSIISHVDALSRYPVSSASDTQKNTVLCAYLSPTLQAETVVPILDTIRIGEYTAKAELPTGDKYEKEDQLLYKTRTTGTEVKKVLWIPPALRQELLKCYHDPPSIGHAGVKKMKHAMSSEVYWSNLDRDIANYVRNCEVCQRFKLGRPMPLWQKTSVPEFPFDDISLDVVGPAPNSLIGNRYVLVTQCRFTRYIDFAGMPDTSALTTARTCLDHWVCKQGPPLRILTDRGTNFTSVLFEEFSKFLGAKNTFTCAYRPQGNGQNERSHRELHQYIAMYTTGADASNWDALLQQAAYVHNTSVHEALQTSPYELVYGMKPRHLLPGKNREFLKLTPERLETLRQNAKIAIAKGQAGYLAKLNLNRNGLEYNVGDIVLIRSKRNLRATTYVDRKWSEKFQGPYKILEKVSPVVYRVQDVNDHSYTDLVHASYIKHYHREQKTGNIIDITNLPVIGSDPIDLRVSHEADTTFELSSQNPNPNNNYSPASPEPFDSDSSSYSSYTSSSDELDTDQDINPRQEETPTLEDQESQEDQENQNSTASPLHDSVEESRDLSDFLFTQTPHQRPTSSPQVGVSYPDQSGSPEFSTPIRASAQVSTPQKTPLRTRALKLLTDSARAAASALRRRKNEQPEDAPASEPRRTRSSPRRQNDDDNSPIFPKRIRRKPDWLGVAKD